MTRAPVTPTVLRWARMTINMSVEEAARRLGVDAATLERWEEGEDLPTYSQ